MSAEYNDYLREHIFNVKAGAEWLIHHDLVDSDKIDILRSNIDHHDSSKKLPGEYDAYDEYFYTADPKDPLVKKAFDYAWLDHIHKNGHHWQYWVLINDDEGKSVGLEMPKEDVYEMIADWWSFSWKSKNLFEIFDWYADHEPKMILHPNTRKLVESILDQMEKILYTEKAGNV